MGRGPRRNLAAPIFGPNNSEGFQVKLNTWVKAAVVTAVIVAIIFRVPMLERVVIGSNTTRG